VISDRSSFQGESSLRLFVDLIALAALDMVLQDAFEVMLLLDAKAASPLTLVGRATLSQVRATCDLAEAGAVPAAAPEAEAISAMRDPTHSNGKSQRSGWS
jgi:hypothetical protein